MSHFLHGTFLAFQMAYVNCSMRLVKILLLVFLVTSSAIASSKKEAVNVTDFKSTNVFSYKGNTKMIGATVEVFTAEGVLVTKQTLRKRRLHIDFGEVKSGEYTIRISKGEKLKEYQFIKKL